MNSLEILDHPTINQRYFFPLSGKIPNPFWVECQGARLACSYHERDRGAPTIVHFHGNGEVVADYLAGFTEVIGRMGFNSFLVEYRGYGESTGTPQLGRMLEDVRDVIAAIKQPHAQLVLFGRSVGSLFAVKAAELFPDIAGLILESAIADPLERLLLRVTPAELGVSRATLAAAVERAMGTQQCLQSFTKPTLILHTRNDSLVDVSHAKRLASWCSGPTHLEIFAQGDHNDIMQVNATRYFALVNKFIASL